MKDHVMDDWVKEKQYILKVWDIVMHLGIEVLDSIDKHSSRESYLSDITESISKTMFISSFSDFSFLDPLKKKVFIKVSTCCSVLSKELLKISTKQGET